VTWYYVLPISDANAFLLLLLKSLALSCELLTPLLTFESMFPVCDIPRLSLYFQTQNSQAVLHKDPR
jgi:hypothetical protein